MIDPKQPDSSRPFSKESDLVGQTVSNSRPSLSDDKGTKTADIGNSHASSLPVQSLAQRLDELNSLEECSHIFGDSPLATSIQNCAEAFSTQSIDDSISLLKTEILAHPEFEAKIALVGVFLRDAFANSHFQQLGHLLKEASNLDELLPVHQASSPQTLALIAWYRAQLEWARLLCSPEAEQASSEREEVLRHYSQVARHAHLSHATVELILQEGLNALRRGELQLGKERIRQGTRMASSEGQGRSFTLAAWALTRFRRLEGRPHLARLIGGAQLHSSRFQTLLQWELGLAGKFPTNDASLDQQFLSALTGSNELVQLQSWCQLLGILKLEEEIPALFRQDWSDLKGCSGSSSTSQSTWVRDWQLGKGKPFTGFEGLVARLNPEANSLASVIVRSTGEVQRKLQFFHDLSQQLIPSLDLGEESLKRPNRMSTSVVVLAQSTQMKLEEARFFEEVYGFSYRKELHQGVLKVLLHRLRQKLEGFAEVVKDSDCLCLRPLCDWQTVDPRCSITLADRVLANLAENQGSGATDLSENLNYPLRTVQAALQELVEEGAIEMERAGRKVRYKVEDTSFCEPTQP